MKRRRRGGGVSVDSCSRKSSYWGWLDRVSLDGNIIIDGNVVCHLMIRNIQRMHQILEATLSYGNTSGRVVTSDRRVFGRVTCELSRKMLVLEPGKEPCLLQLTSGVLLLLQELVRRRKGNVHVEGLLQAGLCVKVRQRADTGAGRAGQAVVGRGSRRRGATLAAAKRRSLMVYLTVSVSYLTDEGCSGHSQGCTG